jgi:hypothetical protein
VKKIYEGVSSSRQKQKESSSSRKKSPSVSPLNYFIEKNTMYRGVEQRGKRYRAQIVVSKKRRSLFSFILNLSPLYCLSRIFSISFFFFFTIYTFIAFSFFFFVT